MVGEGLAPPNKIFLSFFFCGINALSALLTEAYPYFLNQFHASFQEKFVPFPSGDSFEEGAMPHPLKKLFLFCVELTHFVHF